MRAFTCVFLFAVLSVHVGFTAADERTTPTSAKAKADVGAKTNANVDTTVKTAEKDTAQPITAQLVEPKSR